MRKLKDFNSILGHDKLLVAELFKGYGSQSLSLDSIGIPNEVVVGSEIDPDAIISYASARFSQEELNKEINLTDEEIKKWLMDKNIGYDFQKNKSSIPRMKKDKLHKLYNSCILTNEVGDISLINSKDLPNFDLMTYSFPCQDVSISGKQKGIIQGQTRSGLLWECEKIIKEKMPKYLLMENVKNLVSKKFKPDFDKWCEFLTSLGYTNYWQVLNAKDYGVPQNRERVFMVSILGEHDKYIFPQKEDLKLRLKDILEDEVDEKYYISNEKTEKLIKQFQVDINKNFLFGVEQKNQSVKYDGISTTLTSSMGTGGGYVPMVKDLSPVRLGNIYGDNKGTGFAGNVWDNNSICPTLTTMQEGNRQPMTIAKQNPKEDKIICEQRSDEGLRFFKDEMCGTLRTIDSCEDKRVVENNITENNTYRIRKLTPKECFRLMGIDDEIFDKIKASGISNSQLYKQAGNSIVKNCLDKIFLELFFDTITKNEDANF